MTKNQVEVGKMYVCKVSQSLETVRITSESQYGGWNAVNARTGRNVRIRSAQRLRYQVDWPLCASPNTNYREW